MKQFLFLVFTFVSLILIGSNLAEAYVASSDNYQLEKDSLNVGGGELSSDNYSLGGTVGEVGTGDLSGTNYDLRAGYRAMETGADIFLTVTAPSDISLASISEVGGVSVGQANWTVSTNNPSGYRLSVKASTDPALKTADSVGAFTDYNPGVNPSLEWQVESESAAFGFTVESDDVIDRFKNNGSSCGSGSSEADFCWIGFSTSDQTIAERASANDPAGSEVSLKVQAEAASGANLPAGSYSAALTVTAITL